MPLLRFESDVLQTPGSETPESLIRALTAARDEFVASESVDFDDDANHCARLPDCLSFFVLPEQQLHAYEKHRECSELGHIFRIANGLQDHIDALVVLGDCGGFVAAQALAEACCDPFHNELSRAARGSKPRIYFAGTDWDNDQIHSLSQRISAGGYGDTPGEKHWAMISIEGSSTESAIERYLLQLIDGNRTVVPEAVRDSIVTSIGCAAHQSGEPGLRIPSQLSDAQRALTPAVLLPAAFLGLDCIQLLVGAAAANTAFRTEPFETNPVLRYVAATEGHPEAFGWWPRSLAGLDRWVGRLGMASDAETQRCHEIVPIDAATADVGWGVAEKPNVTCTHVCADVIRTDPIVVPAAISNRSDGESGVQTIQDSVRERFRQTHDQLRGRGVRQSVIRLPAIDTHSLGQCVQFFLLSQAVRDRLGD